MVWGELVGLSDNNPNNSEKKPQQPNIFLDILSRKNTIASMNRLYYSLYLSLSPRAGYSL